MSNFAAVLDYHADRRPDEISIVHDDTPTTNAELLERVQALAAALLELGVGLGDRVAALLYNRREFLELLFAANRIGAVFLPLNYRLAPAEWSYVLGHSGAMVLVTEPEFADAVEPLVTELPELRQLVLVTAAADVSAPWRRYDTLVESHLGTPVPVADVAGEDLQRLMYTSGTTARPKGVCISHQNLLYKNLGMLVQFGWDATEVTAVAGPLYHVGALDMGGLATLHAGGRLVLQTRFDAAALVRLIEQYRVTSVWLAPAMVNSVLQVPDLTSADLSSLRLILSGGEKMPEARLRQILDVFPDVWFADAYGSTETVSSDTFVTRQHMRDKLGSVGRPLPHIRVRVVDEAGHEVPRGELGEIVIRGPKVFSGYWRDPEATAAAIRDGWYHSGDVGYQDDDGFFYIVDRRKDMIVSGGENIATPEVERVLYEHPDVLEAAVVGRPDERWGEVPQAFVVLRPGVQPDQDALIAFCRERLARFKVPRSVQFESQLPRTASGKVLKRILRESLANGTVQ